jgi:hypothetical protein
VTRATSRFDAFADAINQTRATAASARPAIVLRSRLPRATTCVLRSIRLHVAFSS